MSGIQTHNPRLGRTVRYQLRHHRLICVFPHRQIVKVAKLFPCKGDSTIAQGEMSSVTTIDDPRILNENIVMADGLEPPMYLT